MRSTKINYKSNYYVTDNFGKRYTALGNRIGSQEAGSRDKGDLVSDITASFVVLIGIFFPSVTGIDNFVWHCY